MSRSRKKTPISGMTTCKSEKQDKRKANRKLRFAVRVAISNETEILPELREISNVWSFGKDGKQWLGDLYPKESRK